MMNLVDGDVGVFVAFQFKDESDAYPDKDVGID